MSRTILLIGLVGILCLAFGMPAGSQVVFSEQTAAAGIDHVQHHHQAPPDCLFSGGQFCEPERMTGGAAVADVNGDGWLDIYITRLDATDLLFANRGDGTFEDITTEAGLDILNLQSNGAVFGDLDNDGDPDLYVTTLGVTGDPDNSRNHLFINDGTGIFTEEGVSRGAAVDTGRPHLGYSVTCGDFDRDGWLDLHMVRRIATNSMPAFPSTGPLLE